MLHSIRQQPEARGAGSTSRASRIGALFVASSLFPADAAAAFMKAGRAYFHRLGDVSTFVVPETLASDRASLSKALAELDLAGLDGLIVQLSTFAAAELLHDLLASASADLPVAIWGLEERDEIVTNSLCGAQLWSSTLARLGRRTTFIMGNVDDAHTAAQITAFAAGARAATGIKRARIALVGAHADWFTNLAVDPALLRRTLGATIVQTSLPKFIAACMAGAEATTADEARWQDVVFDSGRTLEDRKAVAATYARLRAGLDTLDADAVAIRDWPEILYGEAFRGTWSALGELAARAVPVAPEGDVMGALTALAARAFDPDSLPFLTDISGVDRAANHLVLWHYGVSPKLAAGPRRIDAVLKQETFRLKPGPLTLLRLSLSPGGEVRLFITEGSISERDPAANRAAGLFVPRARPAAEIVRPFVEGGWEHHVTGLYGHWAEAALVLGRHIGASVEHV